MRLGAHIVPEVRIDATVVPGELQDHVECFFVVDQELAQIGINIYQRPNSLDADINSVVAVRRYRPILVVFMKLVTSSSSRNKASPLF